MPSKVIPGAFFSISQILPKFVKIDEAQEKASGLISEIFKTEAGCKLIGKSKWVKGKYQDYSIAFWFGHRFDI